MSKRFVALAVMALLLALLLLIGPTLASDASTVAIPWWTIDSGGGESSSAIEDSRELSTGEYSVQGSIGQPDAGVLTGSSYRLIGGYWGIKTATTEFRLCLPVVARAD